jgi:hypothetical protein
MGVLTVVLLAYAATAGAVGIPLSDHNSSLTVNPYSQSGMVPWVVDGAGQLWSQWFWFRVGTGWPEYSVQNLTLLGAVATNTNADPADDTLTLTYGGHPPLQPFTMEIGYSLIGAPAGSRSSQIAETVRISNTGTTPLEMHFFQYSDFDLTGSSNDDSARRVDASTYQQWDASTLFTETVETTTPDHYEIALFPTILANLTDGLVTTLGDTVPLLGPGDMTWAIEWDVEVAAGESILIETLNEIAPVPNPATLLLLGSGLLGALLWRRWRLA